MGDDRTGRGGAGRDYLPPLRFRALTRLYDPAAALIREREWKQELVRQVELEPGMRAVDMGCGTGTLTLLLARHCPAAEVVGVDPDPEALAIARRKGEAAGLRVSFREGRAEAPPFPAGSCDRVVMSLVLHHLRTGAKLQALARARALLRPGGRLHVADWGKPRTLLFRAAFLPVQLLDGVETTADNVHGLLPDLMRNAGFAVVEETARYATALGVISLFRAR